MTDNASRSEKTLADFVQYCQDHPEQRFWQALRNWCGYTYIMATDTQPQDMGDGWDHRGLSPRDILDRMHNTFYWEGKNDKENL